MKILITGANGFIGKAIQESLAKKYSIYAMVRDHKSCHKYDQIEYIEHDFTHRLDTSKLPSKIDTIVHLAQSNEYRDFPNGMRNMIDVNVSGITDILEYARKAEANRFINLSSGSVYSSDPSLQTESSPVLPTSAYPTTKYISEKLTNLYKDFFATLNIRLFFPYGPGQKGMLIPNLIESVKAGKQVNIQGNDGGLRICPIYIDDLINVLDRCLHAEIKGTLNVAGNQIVTLTEIVETISELVGKSPILKIDNQATPAEFAPSLERLNALLDGYQTTALIDGIRKTVIS